MGSQASMIVQGELYHEVCIIGGPTDSVGVAGVSSDNHPGDSQMIKGLRHQRCHLETIHQSDLRRETPPHHRLIEQSADGGSIRN